jgi:Trypsin-co-occurring domain 1
MTEIKVEVVSPDTGEASFGPRAMPDFKERAGDIGKSLNEVAVALREHLHELGERAQDGWDLDEVQLGFSLELQAEAGVIVARASSRAGFQATMMWKRSR